MKYTYTLETDENGYPVILRSTDPLAGGISWRDAKKQLRQFYLNKAASLRQVTEKDYFVQS